MSVLTGPPGTDADAAERAASSRSSSPGPTAAHVASATPAAPRARLRMPHGLTSMKFALIVGAILAGGLVSLLMINTSLAAGAIKLGGLESTLARATEQREALEVEIDGISSPAALQRAAAGLGMVPAASPAFLDPATGLVSGDLSPAAAPTEPFEQAPQVAPEPTPAPDPGQDDGDAGGSTSRDLVPDGLTAVPDPIPTAPVPTDPGADGAVVIRPGAAPGPLSSAVPSPTPAPIPVAGDAASVVTQEGD